MKKQYQAPKAEATSLQTIDGILNAPTLVDAPADDSEVFAPEETTTPEKNNPWGEEW